jgi:hypothetical protein
MRISERPEGREEERELQESERAWQMQEQEDARLEEALRSMERKLKSYPQFKLSARGSVRIMAPDGSSADAVHLADVMAQEPSSIFFKRGAKLRADHAGADPAELLACARAFDKELDELMPLIRERMDSAQYLPSYAVELAHALGRSRLAARMEREEMEGLVSEKKPDGGPSAARRL